MKKFLLLIIAVVGVAVLRAQVPYERIATSPAAVKAKQINNKGHQATRRVAKAPQTVPTGIETVPLNAIEVPFTHGLGKGSQDVETVKKYTVIDGNKDGRTWKVAAMTDYTACMPPNAADINEADDWLVTVPVYMPAVIISCRSNADIWAPVPLV